MTPTKFDELVSNLANKRVQERIRVFKEEFKAACKKLHREAPGYGSPLWCGAKG